jgi:RNA polymerase sigma factor (sigma-70 family)
MAATEDTDAADEAGGSITYEDLFGLYKQLHPQLMRYLLAALPCMADAEDVASDVWPAMIDRLKNERIVSPSALLTMIAKRRLSNWYRKNSIPRLELTGKAEDAAAAILYSEMPDAIVSDEGLATAIRELPLRQREAVFLRYVAGLTTAETAANMGITGRRVCQLLASALKSLRRSLYTRDDPPQPRTEAS